jgi:2-aminoadipate transaminase
MNYSLGDNLEFSKENIKNTLMMTLKSDSVYTYSSTKGYRPLRELLANILSEKLKVVIDPSDIILTSSSQQSIYFLSKILSINNKTIISEEPTYFGAVENFKSLNLKIKPIEIFKNGINISKLKNLIKEKKPSFIYLVPTFNNPTGVCYSEKNKKEILSLCNKNDIKIIEDSPYSEYDIFNIYPKAMFSLSDSVIYMGTFSKIICPSLSVGYIISKDKNIMNKLYLEKKNCCLTNSLFIENFIFNYLKNFNINEEFKEKNEILLKNYEFLKDFFKNHNKSFKLSNYKGGMFLTIKVKNKTILQRILDSQSFKNNEESYFTIRGKDEIRINLFSVDSDITKYFN